MPGRQRLAPVHPDPHSRLTDRDKALGRLGTARARLALAERRYQDAPTPSASQTIDELRALIAELEPMVTEQTALDLEA